MSTQSTLVPELSVCIPIYNNAQNFKSLIDSIQARASRAEISIDFLVRNDGSSIPGIEDEVRSYCDANSITFMNSERNAGVPFSWNRLTEAATSEIVVMLNDDLRAGEQDWASEIHLLFARNPSLGIVYWCQRQINPASGLMTKVTADSKQLLDRTPATPLLRHNFAGAFFAFRKSLWRQIFQPDGSVGFWSDLVSFFEEIDFSCEALDRGYFILQLPILWDHLHSQTFSANPEKKLRKELSSYLPLEEYRTERSIRQRSRLSRLKRLFSLRSSAPAAVERLDYSRAMLLKKWSNRRILGVPGPEYIDRMQHNGFPTALGEAVKAGGFTLPGEIVIRQAEVEVSLDAMTLLPPDEDSLS